jgi:hypothetical protein
VQCKQDAIHRKNERERRLIKNQIVAKANPGQTWNETQI